MPVYKSKSSQAKEQPQKPQHEDPAIAIHGFRLPPPIPFDDFQNNEIAHKPIPPANQFDNFQGNEIPHKPTRNTNRRTRVKTRPKYFISVGGSCFDVPWQK